MTLLLAAILLTPHSQVQSGAAFLKSLSSTQRSLAVYPLDSPSRFDWHYVPRARPGISYESLDASQRSLAIAFLKSNISQAGFARTEAIRALEPVLYQLENRNPSRNAEGYFFAFFGEPAEKGVWAWRYEGHHISMTFAFRDGALVTSSPQFLGSNPANRAPRPMASEQDLGFAFLDSLTADQKRDAVISGRTFGDIVTRATKEARIDGHAGLSYSKLTSAQKSALMEILSTHSNVQLESERERRLALIRNEELSDFTFAWAGSQRPGAPHYYRIQGKNLIVEYDNSEGNGNHIHTVWRNRKEDFGGASLADHYRQGHRH